MLGLQSCTTTPSSCGTGDRTKGLVHAKHPTDGATSPTLLLKYTSFVVFGQNQPRMEVPCLWFLSFFFFFLLVLAIAIVISIFVPVLPASIYSKCFPCSLNPKPPVPQECFQTASVVELVILRKPQ